ncbi:hypothetical protein [Tahibacter amnicola]|uniref:FTP domain-containing protein n=1 Tax=Tahibacter amnicola TaxID=2976241 RepID=A0ABY6BAD0_9GAMM|nr:hypothetical protein [Tahibacter amnicola]UXI66496.1 hypothetical protein N4264_17300 [Tahibacter amnicola]
MAILVRSLSAALALALTTGAAPVALALSPASPEGSTLALSLTRGVEEKPVFLAGVDGDYRTDGTPATVFSPRFKATARTPRAAALEYLTARGPELGLNQADLAGLVVRAERSIDTMGIVRFTQQVDGLPVYGSSIVVTAKNDGTIVYVANGSVRGVATVAARAVLAQSEAIAAAMRHLEMKPLRHSDAVQMLYQTQDGTRPVWRVLATSVDARVGGWEILVDATDGRILRSQTIEHNVDGTATVFKPDPLSFAKVSYSTAGYADNNNADSPQLTAALQSVVLRDITSNGGQYSLAGPYAVCTEWEAPADAACPTQASTNFSVTRSAMTFDATMVYYHVDTFMRYVNLTLGIAVMPIQYSGGVKIDPHGEEGADNSHYNGATGELVFGEGGVDDAQDADVIIHELGHGLHDWITDGGLSQVEGLSEGVGDYLAQAYSRDFPNQWTSADAAYHWVFNYDGHNPFWPGRITNYHVGHSYPNNIGSGHTAGQYFASCNIVARDAIGGQAMDKAFLAGLAMTNENSTQKQTAQAIINAAGTLGYNATQINGIAQAFNTSCNYAVTVPPVSDVIFANGFQ